MLRLNGFLSTVFLLLIAASFSFAQAADEFLGCGATDYKCQLDKRTAALKADPKNASNYYNLALVLQRSGDCAKAVESYNLYLAIPGVKDEFRADGLNNRGICYRRLGKPDQALADHTEAIKLNPKNPGLYVSRASDSLDLKKADDALADYARAIAADAKFALAFANRGHYYAGIGKADDALKDLNQAIELNPTAPEPYYTRAQVFRSKSDFAKAIVDLDKYLSFDLQNPQYAAEGHINRAISYGMSGKMETALADATRAIELAPKYIDAYQVRAIIYRELKKPELAAADEKTIATLKKP